MNPVRNLQLSRYDTVSNGVKKQLWLLVVILALSGCVVNPPVSQTQLLMGTTAQIRVADRDVSKKEKLAAIIKAFDRIKEIEALMSLYRETSDVSMVNNFADIRPVRVSDDTVKVLKRADEIYSITGGVFDITVGPLVELWGFGKKGGILTVPQETDIKNALRLVGMDKIKIDYAKKTVSFSVNGMKIDLGGIAAGYAVDCAIDVLKEYGIKDAMVDIGGDIFCMGSPGWGKPWRIGIQHPRIKNEILANVEIEDKAITTSGDYEKFFFQGEKRESHIINPRTGLPVSDTPASVSIIAPDCMTADAMATAVFVLGPKDGIDVLNKMASISGMIAVDNNNMIEIYKTDGFGKR